ncbi:MAG: hypothetical protein ABW219_11715 [Ilumatobacteraceae bacterium]
MLDSIFFADAPGVAPFRARFMAQAGYDPIDVLAVPVVQPGRLGLPRPADHAHRPATTRPP